VGVACLRLNAFVVRLLDGDGCWRAGACYRSLLTLAAPLAFLVGTDDIGRLTTKDIAFFGLHSGFGRFHGYVLTTITVAISVRWCVGVYGCRSNNVLLFSAFGLCCLTAVRAKGGTGDGRTRLPGGPGALGR